MKVALINKKSETDDIKTYQFKPSQPVRWQAGQFIQYQLPHQPVDDRGIERYFTIASAPFESYLQITTRLNKSQGSSFKLALDNLQIGDVIEASEPMGEFVIDNVQTSYVFIAGGIGITPFRSILLELSHLQQPINIALLYASRTSDIAFEHELNKLAEEHPTFSVSYFIGEHQIQVADITNAVKKIGGSKTEFYISGPKPMVGSFKQQLLDAGYEKRQIKTDYFPGYSN